MTHAGGWKHCKPTTLTRQSGRQNLVDAQVVAKVRYQILKGFTATLRTHQLTGIGESRLKALGFRPFELSMPAEIGSP